MFSTNLFFRIRAGIWRDIKLRSFLYQILHTLWSLIIFRMYWSSKLIQIFFSDSFISRSTSSTLVSIFSVLQFDRVIKSSLILFVWKRRLVLLPQLDLKIGILNIVIREVHMLLFLQITISSNKTWKKSELSIANIISIYNSFIMTKQNSSSYAFVAILAKSFSLF